MSVSAKRHTTTMPTLVVWNCVKTTQIKVLITLVNNCVFLQCTSHYKGIYESSYAMWPITLQDGFNVIGAWPLDSLKKEPLEEARFCNTMSLISLVISRLISGETW